MSEGMFSDRAAQIYRKSGLFFYPAIAVHSNFVNLVLFVDENRYTFQKR